jgi:DNA mismatch repair protein MutL
MLKYFMPKITILPEDLRNKIAAGEVVERPASVVKELIENSIDAGSSRIEIDILRSGKRLIRVSDNGEGMDREDTILSIQRHATSKIKNEDDLSNIKTMGFRGEALSSIASVSKLNLITSKKGEIGTFLETVGGEIKKIQSISANGTTVEVWDLFFNTPARKKFLKSDSTEKYHIIDTVIKISLSHYWIGFVLRSDKKEILNLPPASSPKEKIMQIFGTEFAEGLIEIKKEDINNRISISGLISNPANLISQKNRQYLFVNNRPIRDIMLSSAIYNVYEDFLNKDSHPIFFIFLNVNPEDVDFNVHPTKREVRFQNKSLIYDYVSSSIKDILKGFVFEFRKDSYKNPNYTFNPSTERQSFYENLTVSESLKSFVSFDLEKIPFLYLGDTLIAISENNGLTIIDYHASHERINYERLLKGLKNRQGLNSSLRLLIPYQIRLQRSEHELIIDNLDILERFGFEIEDFGHNTLIVRGIPDFLEKCDLNLLMSELSDFFRNEVKKDMPLEATLKSLAAKLACHSSIRGKETPDGYKLAELIKNLNNTDNPNICPHGRPTRIFFTIQELRRLFKK